MEHSYQNVIFECGFLLGWESRERDFLLHVECQLSPDHPKFRPEDRRRLEDCWKVGRLIATDCTEVRGLPKDHMPRVWDDNLGGFEDLGGEIRGFSLQDDRLTLFTTDFEVQVRGAAFDVVID